MFDMYYTGKSLKEIAKELTRRGVKPSFADYWKTNSILRIVRNPIYLGRALACRYAYGVHVVLGVDRPQKTPVNQDDYEDGSRKSIDPIHRPRDEWFVRDEPHLLEYISDPIIRERAKKANDADAEKF